jgi:hypothetical protein
LVSVEEAPVRLEEIEFGASELKLNKLAWYLEVGSGVVLIDNGKFIV